MKIMKRLLSALTVVSMLATSSVAFAWVEGYEPTGNETITTRWLDKAEAIDIYGDDAAVGGISASMTGFDKDCLGYTVNVKIPTGFTVSVNTGTDRNPVWEYQEVSDDNIKDWLPIGITWDAVKPDGTSGEGWKGYQFQRYTTSFTPGEDVFQLILCDETGTLAFPDEAFEITASKAVYNKNDNAFNVKISNWFEYVSVTAQADIGNRKVWDVAIPVADMVAGAVKATLTNATKNATVGPVTLTWDGIDWSAVTGNGAVGFNVFTDELSDVTQDISLRIDAANDKFAIN